MRLIVLVLSCLAAMVVSLSTSLGNDDSSHVGDQIWWGALSQSERVHAVQGMLVAWDEAYDQGVSQALLYAAKRQGHSKEWAMDMRRSVHFDRFSKPADYYVDGISAYYRKHTADASLNTDVGQILGCLADSPFLSCDELAKAVEGG